MGEPKEEPPGNTGTEYISITVNDQAGGSLQFKAKPTTTVGRLITTYCDRKGVNPGSVRFLYDGSRLSPDKTMKDIGIEDGDVIDVMVAQTGGGCAHDDRAE